MKISLDWLKDFVQWEDTPEDLAAKLTAAGLNVENIESFAQTFPGVVVARVLHREQHPDADRLSLCRVDAGDGAEVQVVCGAANVREGLTVLFAKVGSVLPGNFKIKKSKIRGVESLGMICSAGELGLASDTEGIMELETELPPGTPADEIFGFSDTVLDIEVTPNRPDWLSHLGVAREVAAIYDTKVTQPRIWAVTQGADKLGIQVRVQNYGDCPRYMAFGARGLKIGPAPAFMQNRLRAVGSRSISNVVDITNYVMLEMGQPLHAFDAGKLTGVTITVERATGKTLVTTLDGVERDIPPDTLLICDEAGPVALAGVMGLAASEVDQETQDILLESAYFEPMLVRQGSRALGLISESSYRFERRADWAMVEKAACRVLFLLQEHAGAHVLADWADRSDPDREEPAPIPLRIWQVNRVLGTDLSTETAAQHLQKLGLKVQPLGNPEASNPSAVNMMVAVPSFRRDLEQEADLIEEIARSYGFDHLGSGKIFRGYEVGGRRGAQRVQERLRQWLIATGFQEIVTSSFMSPRELSGMLLAEDDLRRQSLTVLNPHHGGETMLRTTLIPSLLQTVCRNINSGAEIPLRLFQMDRVFWPGSAGKGKFKHEDEKLLPAEPLYLQFAVVGRSESGLGDMPAGILELKGIVEAIAAHLRLPLVCEVAGQESWLEPGVQWTIRDGDGQVVGSGGLVRKDIRENFEVETSVAVGELELGFMANIQQPVEYQEFTRFPAVKRDLSLLVPDGIAYGQIKELVRQVGGEHLVTVKLFDIYRGKGLPEGFGAYGIRLKFLSTRGNLKGKTVDRAIDAILETLSAGLKIEPRSRD